MPEDTEVRLARGHLGPDDALPKPARVDGW